jgi:hypothetical protein
MRELLCIRPFPTAGSQRFTTKTAIEVEMNSQHEPETIKIVVEEVSDGFRIFHTNFELTTLEGQQVSRHEVSTDGEFAPIATEVVQLPGVETVILRPYGSGIHKAMAFDREDISPAAKEVLLWVGKTFGVDQKPKPNKPKRRMVQTEA